MDLPVKCGQMYIKFDENGKNEYGYIVEDRTIYKVLNLRKDEKQIDELVLPDFGFDKNESSDGGTVNKAKLCKIKNQFSKDSPYGYFAHTHTMERYLKGSVRIAPDSIKSCKNIANDLKIVVPGDYSIMLCHNAFEDETKCNFILKNDMDLYTVYRYSINGYDNDYWHLIAHKELEDMESFNNTREHFDFRKYDVKNIGKFERVIYTTSHLDEKE